METKLNCLISLFVTLLWVNSLSGQNLVPNPSFEQTLCTNQGTFSAYQFCNWFRPKHDIGTPDGFENDSNGIGNSTPWTGPYIQRVPGQNTFAGKAITPYGTHFMGGLMYYIQGNQSNFVENACTKLSQTLVAGLLYKIGFYVKHGERSKYIINNIGVKLSNDTLDAGLINNHFIQTVPSVNYTQSIGVNSGWTNVQGIYTAKGTEKYLTLGRFIGDPQTTITVNPKFNTNDASLLFAAYGAYYFFDSVYVELVTVNQLDELNNKGVNVFPNPCKGTFSISGKGIDFDSIQLISIAGEKLKFNIDPDKVQSDVIKMQVNYVGLGILSFKTITGEIIFRKIYLE